MHHAFRMQLRPQTIVAVGAERRDQPVALCRLYDWLKTACLRVIVVRGLDVYGAWLKNLKNLESESSQAMILSCAVEQ